ncbi:hypothetical protein [Flavobacterium inviolabile]|uniref:hypothetical protein n=1 Tax=Flavobacterium inviolabile TaxID=2748320 RepID=UPI0015AF85E0|nr:hypothetical protein [Flavobacterium inviolabile]
MRFALPFKVSSLLRSEPFPEIKIGFCPVLFVPFCPNVFKFYYSSFDIDITGFINISDVINLFLSDSISICISLLAPIFAIINNLVPDDEKEINEKKIREEERTKVLKKAGNDFGKMLDKLPNYSGETKENQEIPITKQKYTYYSLIVTIVLFSVLIYMLNLKQNLTIIALYLPFATLIPICVIKSFDNTKYEIRKYYFEILFTFGLIGIFTINIYSEYFKVMNNLKYKEICFETEEETLQFNSNQIFIGNTEKYYFFRDLKNEENVIINSDQIKKLYL